MIMVMELFPKKHYKESISEDYGDLSGGRVYIGEAPLKEDDKEQEYEHMNIQLKQYGLADGSFIVNELAVIETESGSLGGYGKVMDYDILNERCGAEFLSSVLIANGENYAYIYSGSRKARVGLYRFAATGLRITRLSFDNRFITADDLRDVIDKVFLRGDGGASILLRSASCLKTEQI